LPSISNWSEFVVGNPVPLVVAVVVVVVAFVVEVVALAVVVEVEAVVVKVVPPAEARSVALH
jgi:hypothetical protein